MYYVRIRIRTSHIAFAFANVSIGPALERKANAERSAKHRVKQQRIARRTQRLLVKNRNGINEIKLRQPGKRGVAVRGPGATATTSQAVRPFHVFAFMVSEANSEAIEIDPNALIDVLVAVTAVGEVARAPHRPEVGRALEAQGQQARRGQLDATLHRALVDVEGPVSRACGALSVRAPP